VINFVDVLEPVPEESGTNVIRLLSSKLPLIPFLVAFGAARGGFTGSTYVG
jgi:hypothetical protein